MEDLGRIVIDVNASGGGGGGGGGGSFAAMREGAGTIGGVIAGNLSQAGIRSTMGLPMVGGMVSELMSITAKTGLVGLAITTILGALTIQIKAIVSTFKVLDRAATNLSRSLADMDPNILVAQAQNEIRMFNERMRASAQYGGVMGGYETAGGRLDRAMFRLSSALGAMSAGVLTPLLNIAAFVAEVIEKQAIPAIKEATQKILLGLSQMFIGLANAVEPYSPKMFWSFVAVSASLSSMANSFNTVAKNSNQMAMTNQPFLDDLRLMGAKV